MPELPYDPAEYPELGFNPSNNDWGPLPVGAVTFPYRVDMWERLCWTVYDDGSGGTDALIPQPGCTDAQCAYEAMPPGTKRFVISKPIKGGEVHAVQLSDVSAVQGDGVRILAGIARYYPHLWLRVDSGAELSDLTAYRHRLSWNRYAALPKEARAKVDVCLLVPPTTPVAHPPALDVRVWADTGASLEAPPVSMFLLEDGDALLLEDGEVLLI
jgi:hypothetical protein